MSHIETVIDGLSTERRAHFDTLIRGVAHSARARGEFNEMCHELDLVPNEVLRLFRPVPQSTPAPPVGA